MDEALLSVTVDDAPALSAVGDGEPFADDDAPLVSEPDDEPAFVGGGLAAGVELSAGAGAGAELSAGAGAAAAPPMSSCACACQASRRADPNPTIQMDTVKTMKR